MTDQSDTELDFSVRLIGVRHEVARQLGDKYVDLHPEISSYFKDKSLNVVSFPICGGVDANLMSGILSNLSEDFLMADLFVSISSDLDTQILDIPQYVVDVIKVCDIDLKISYTIFPDLDDDC